MNEICRDFLCTAAPELHNHGDIGCNPLSARWFSEIAILSRLSSAERRYHVSTAIQHVVQRNLATSGPEAAGDFRAVLPLGNVVRMRWDLCIDFARAVDALVLLVSMRNKICSADQNLTKIGGNVLKQVKNHSYNFGPDRTTGRVDIGFELRRRRR